MVLTVVTKKGEDVPHLRLEGIADEFCRLVPTGQCALDQMTATVHGAGHLSGIFQDDQAYDASTAVGFVSKSPAKQPPAGGRPATTSAAKKDAELSASRKRGTTEPGGKSQSQKRKLNAPARVPPASKTSKSPSSKVKAKRREVGEFG
jgi:hypothetical protein